VIEVSSLCRKFGDFCAVDNVSFSIETGEIVGLLGPNGAGKTTTMRMITGFLEPTSGCVKIDGLDVTEFPVQTKAKIGYMSESAPMYKDMIVADYLKYVAEIQGQNAAEKIPHLAEICGLKEVMHKNISDLSRGNKQRVGLAHALMGDPEILILDEPTSGLDPNQVQEVRNLIKEIGKTRTVIISTHILSEVEMLCNRVIIISSGKKVADGPTEELLEHYGSSNVISIILENATEQSVKEKISAVDGAAAVSVKSEGNKFYASVSVKDGKEIRGEVAKVCVENGWNLLELVLRKNTLEDVFRILTNGGAEK
jgi:ABC-2 type transport system ATP-binding protein